jgi:hypothetical protein
VQLDSSRRFIDVQQVLPNRRDILRLGALAAGTRALPLHGAQSVPAWSSRLAVNEWREIAGSAMALALPTNTAYLTTGTRAIGNHLMRMDAWCGLSIDTRASTVWSLANGGHGDYYGNEVLMLDLMSSAPKWIEWCSGSEGRVVDGVTAPTDPSHARYKDGLPCSTHSYYGQQFLERQNRALRLGGSTAPYGTAFENVEGYDIAVRDPSRGWDPPGTFGFCVGGVNSGWTPAIGWSACKDPRTEAVYVISTPFIRKFTPAPSGVGGSWAVLGKLPAELNSGAFAATAVDTKRNRLLWLKGQGPNRPYTCDLVSGAWTAREHPSGGAKGELDAHARAPGMVYVPALDAYLLRANVAGDQVLRIDADTLAVSVLPTSGGKAVPQGAVLNKEENVYNRWLHVPALNGVVYFARSQANAWFLRLH